MVEKEMRPITLALLLAVSPAVLFGIPTSEATTRDKPLPDCPKRDSARIVRDAFRMTAKRTGGTFPLRVMRFTRTDSGTVVEVGPLPSTGRRAVSGGGATVIVPTYFGPCILQVQR